MRTNTAPLLASSVFFDAPILTRRNAVKPRRSALIISLSAAPDALSGPAFDQDDSTLSINPMTTPMSSPSLSTVGFSRPLDPKELSHILQMVDAQTPAPSPVLSNGLGFNNFGTEPETNVDVFESRGLPYDPVSTNSSSIRKLSFKLEFLQLFESMRDSLENPPLMISSPTGSASTLPLSEDIILPTPGSIEGEASEEPFILAPVPSDGFMSPFINQGCDDFGFDLYCHYTFLSEEDRYRLANPGVPLHAFPNDPIRSQKKSGSSLVKEGISKAAKNIWNAFAFGPRAVSPLATRNDSWID